MLGFLVRAFKVGQRIMEHMTDKYVMEVFELSRKVNKEADKIRGFIRFSDNGNYLLAHFEPKCDMIPVVMWHFVDRYPGENFVIMMIEEGMQWSTRGLRSAFISMKVNLNILREVCR